ncbi:hypothetical protein IKI14_01120 [bacterium]|nr:hypothetical protein [bacterium]
MKTVFLSMNNDKKENFHNKFLAQNTENENLNSAENGNISAVNEFSDSDIIDSIEIQNLIDNSVLTSMNVKNFSQCSTAGDVYSEEELNE